jgi:hypothetical protein
MLVVEPKKLARRPIDMKEDRTLVVALSEAGYYN